MFRWIEHRKAVHRAADEMAAQLMAALPPDRQERLLNGPRLAGKPAAVVRRVAAAATRLSAERGLTLLWRASLANRVRWTLRDAGYADAFVESVVSALVVAMEAGRRAGAAAACPEESA